MMETTVRRLSRSLAMAGLLLLPSLAKADTFNFSVLGSGGGFNGSGVLTGNSNANGSFLITGISGAGITGLVAANDPFFLNDNLLFPKNTRLFDVNGIAFTGIFGTVNLFSTVAGYEVQGFDTDGDYFDVPASVSVTSAAAVTPEPSSIALSATGLLMVVAAFFHKRLVQFTGRQTTTLS